MSPSRFVVDGLTLPLSSESLVEIEIGKLSLSLWAEVSEEFRARERSDFVFTARVSAPKETSRESFALSLELPQEDRVRLIGFLREPVWSKQ